MKNLIPFLLFALLIFSCGKQKEISDYNPQDLAEYLGHLSANYGSYKIHLENAFDTNNYNFDYEYYKEQNKIDLKMMNKLDCPDISEYQRLHNYLIDALKRFDNKLDLYNEKNLKEKMAVCRDWRNEENGKYEIIKSTSNSFLNSLLYK